MPYEVLHNASIMTAVGCCGLQLYNFGETVSFCFWDDSWQPDSYYDKIVRNRKLEYHTLCYGTKILKEPFTKIFVYLFDSLLDIKVKEQTIENLMKGNKIFEPPRYMKTHEAAKQLLDIIERVSLLDICTCS